MSLRSFTHALRVIAVLVIAVTSASALAAAPGPQAAAPPASPVAKQKAPPAAGAEQKAPAAPGVEPKAPVPETPASIPIPEIAKQAEEMTKVLRDFEALAVPPPAIDAIQARLDEVTARLGPELDATIETLNREPPNPIVERIVLFWQTTRLELTGWVETLTKRATQLEGVLDRLPAQRARWLETRKVAQASRAPEAVVQRIDAVLADIDTTRARIQVQRAATLVLQDKVGQELARCQDALDRTAEYRRGGLMRTFVRSTMPIWSPEVRGRELAELPERAREAAVASMMVLRQFADAHTDRLLLQALLFIAVVLVARAARRRARGGAAADEAAVPASALCAFPYSSAAVVALASLSWLYPERPQTVVDLTGMLLLFPVVRIVRPHVARPVVPALFAFAGLCLVDRVRAELAVIPLADQALLLLVMAAAITGLAWLLGSGRLRGTAPEERLAPGWLPPQAVVAVALVVCAASFAAGAYGTMRLARTLGAGLLVGSLMALVAYSAVQVTVALAGFALRTSPLRRLGMVRSHRDLLERRLRTLLVWSAAFAWMVGNLRFHGVLKPAAALGESVLVAELRQGTIGISLGDILAFVLTVWAAFVLSAAIRFVLQEDVYPRLRLAPGVPYVISSLLNYAILFLGFLLAVGALGLDLNRMTVLAGAFGVGLGFGLQNVVNNFVSGLIVLFERPVRVGDAIQMTELAGEVRRIGIRSTTVRTWEGADVIVPNATLVADKVTNWTLSDCQRRMDLPVGVAYGTTPEKVIELLLTVARAHPYVLSAPAPEALFLGFGDSALKFELRAWTGRFDQWVAIRSELGVAVYAALRGAGIEIPLPQHEVRLRESNGAPTSAR